MAITEIASGLVELCKVGNFHQAIVEYYGDDVVSVEPMGETPVVNGIDAVKEKTKWFAENMEVHSMEVTGPFVNGDQFAVRFQLDATMKPTGKRETMDEIGVYTVKDGKIVHEVFMYGG